MKTKTETNPVQLSETEVKMLELLAKGGSSKSIAQSLGYKDGTARVYLHTMYKRIGVNNKTSAVTWYLAREANSVATLENLRARVQDRKDSFGDFALQSDLLACLGVMAIFVGPHSKMWEVANRLNNEHATNDPRDAEQIRARSRRLWNAFLRGDFAEAKREHDAGRFPKLFLESTTDAVVVAAMLLLGGYANCARKAMAAMPSKEGGRIGITQDEKTMLVAIADAVDNSIESAFGVLHQLQESNVSTPVFRQLLIVALFHLHKHRGDLEHARYFANALWADAESVRHHLQALGEKNLIPDNRIPEPPAIPSAVFKQYLAKIMA